LCTKAAQPQLAAPVDYSSYCCAQQLLLCISAADELEVRSTWSLLGMLLHSHFVRLEQQLLSSHASQETAGQNYPC
jgi:hypothetical protein